MALPEKASQPTLKAGLLDGIRLAKENETTAAEYYARAAGMAGTSVAKNLFDQLTEFEKIHYEKLNALEQSLAAKGAFIDYAGTDFVLPPGLRLKMPDLPDQASIMTIISEAVELESRAQKAYEGLAEMTTDPKGFDMFVKLAEEEHKHYRTLKDVYWKLSNLGTWEGPGR